MIFLKMFFIHLSIVEFATHLSLFCYEGLKQVKPCEVIGFGIMDEVQHESLCSHSRITSSMANAAKSAKGNILLAWIQRTDGQ
jgi:hypothetical protein